MIDSAHFAVDSSDFSDDEQKSDVKVFTERLNSLERLHSKAQTIVDPLNSDLLNAVLVSEMKKAGKEKAQAPS